MDQYHQSMLALVKAALEEDVGKGDVTSQGCLEPGPVTGEIVAKCDGVLSGEEPALLVFRIVDSANTLRFLKHDGERYASGDRVAELQGFNQSVLASERVALNFLAHLSGIASLTAQFVDRIRQSGNTRCEILDTRKTTPGWRLLEKRAVQHGGGVNHRIGLYDMVLIKDNHIASAGSIAKAVTHVREFLQTPDFRLQFENDCADVQIEVEVETEEQLREAISANVDRLLLDNQLLDSLAKLVQKARSLDPAVKLEASGNVTLDFVEAIAATGVDYISVGSLTHSAPAADFSMRVRDAQD